jgi:nucleotide-binding universal stress UspA family protein
MPGRLQRNRYGGDVGPALLCFDGSDDAGRAIVQAASLIGGGPALVVHVWEPLSALMLRNPLIHSPGPLVEQAAELDAAGAEAAERLTEEGVQVARSAGFDAEPLCVRSDGGVWPRIVQLADEHDARAIVLGPRGRSAVASVLLGSVSSGVAHHCRRPVLVIPAPDQNRAAPAA